MTRKTDKKKFQIKVAKRKPKMSNGQDYTLANWLELTRIAFGDESGAVRWLKGEVERLGEDYSPEMKEGAMKLLLATLHDHPLVPEA